MHRLSVVILVALLSTMPAVVAADTPSQPDAPSVSPSWEYGDGCSDWFATSTGWVYSCAAYGDTWVYQEAYYWDRDGQVPVLYWQSFFDWVDLWGWSCYVGGACQA